jgi:phospholipase C
VPEAGSPLLKPLSRRNFLIGGASLAAGTAALGALLPAVLGNGTAAAAATAETLPPFDVSQIKHVVFMMQENRSFDHYFGSLPGVRGFSDPDAIVLANGQSVFHQPDPANPKGYLLPFHAPNQALASLTHDFGPQHECWNNGRMDGFVRTHGTVEGLSSGPYTMAYLNQDDLPFHYALANAFTICDNYHCSIMGPTYPNRLMWMTGSVNVAGGQGGPITSNSVLPGASMTWTTPAEILQQNNVSWKVYQPLASATTAQPTTPAQMQTALNVSNHNFFLAFPNIWKADQTVPFGLYQNAALGSTLFGSANGNGLAGKDPSITNPYTGKPFDYTTSFEEDCYNGTLPAVSWIVQPENVTEHPAYRPIDGADYIASKIAAIAANPELWNSTVFILNYDENDGLFDHVPPVIPPTGTANEFLAPGMPIGSGFRVPCIVVSPWTVGGYVASQAFDHTSCLQFIEQVYFGGQPVFPALSDWRREAFGDFMSVFQSGPGVTTSPANPASPSNANLSHATIAALAKSLPNSSPSLPRASQTVPSQPAGTRPTPS